MDTNVFNQLVLTTCRIVATADDGRSQIGTAFFYTFPVQGQDGVLLITNRHVCEGMKTAVLLISQADSEGKAIPGSHVSITVENLASVVSYHPDPTVDLAGFGIMEAIDRLQANGQRPIFKAIGDNLIPPPELRFQAIEDIYMVGYPSGLYDAHHNLPIVRRGITASSFNLDYEGRAEFLIDAACFPGSSGSPVVIANSGSYAANSGIWFGDRFYLLGVLFAGPQFDAEGRLEAVPIPSTLTARARVSIPMNLGYCVKSRLLRDVADVAKQRIYG
jgi:hypothetical protein